MGGIVLPPHIASLIYSISRNADLEGALLKILFDYIDLKLRDISERIRVFEKKYGMSFEEFKKRVLGSDKSYKYDVEKDFWEWESLETLKKYYEELKKRWVIEK